MTADIWSILLFSMVQASSAWFTPRAAQYLLDLTSDCFGNEAVGWDQIVHCECKRGRDPRLCSSAKLNMMYGSWARGRARQAVWATAGYPALGRARGLGAGAGALLCANAPQLNSLTKGPHKGTSRCVDEKSGLELPDRCHGHGFFVQNRYGVQSYIHGVEGNLLKPLRGDQSLGDTVSLY